LNKFQAIYYAAFRLTVSQSILQYVMFLSWRRKFKLQEFQNWRFEGWPHHMQLVNSFWDQ